MPFSSSAIAHPGYMRPGVAEDAHGDLTVLAGESSLKPPISALGGAPLDQGHRDIHHDTTLTALTTLWDTS